MDKTFYIVKNVSEVSDAMKAEQESTREQEQDTKREAECEKAERI